MSYAEGQVVIVWEEPILERGRARKARLTKFIDSDGICERWEAMLTIGKEECFSIVKLKCLPEMWENYPLIGGEKHGNKFRKV